MKLELPDLPYSKDALQPYMSAETLELHHDKHHQAYVTNGNKFIEEQNLSESSINEIVINSYKNNNAPVFNNVSQHINHIHFWEIMSNNPEGKIPGELESKITNDFGSVDQMKNDFINAGITQFGSGWCWLVLNNGKLEVTKTSNAENPIVYGHIPLLGCDVWEHSYYIDFKNRRPDYLKSFIDNLVNWEKVNEEFTKNN
ncbi:superoxide dismutase [Alphaproteobacteria bacterium]|nr:superoxide dismutase [Alphaproteobacteria bacterium]